MKRIVLFICTLLALYTNTFSALGTQPRLADATGTHHAHFLRPATTQTQPTRSTFTLNMFYFNGRIMPGTVSVYVIFWEPANAYVTGSYNRLLSRYFRDVGASSLYHNISQYDDASGNRPGGTVLASSWVDLTPYPARQISDTQIQNEISHAMRLRGWTAGLSHLFVVFTARKQQICSGSNCSFKDFCAYHSYFGKNTIYVVVPYTGSNLAACGVPTSPNNDIDADSAINMASHEQMEAVTDPFANAWLDARGDEIGDKCQWKFDHAIKMGQRRYMLQKEWDNARSGCVLSGP